MLHMSVIQTKLTVICRFSTLVVVASASIKSDRCIEELTERPKRLKKERERDDA